jgi:hypothetical protein
MPQKEDLPDEFAHIPGRGNRPPIVALMAVAWRCSWGAAAPRRPYAFSSTVPTDLGQTRRWPASPWMLSP